MEDIVIAIDNSFKARFLALQLDFSMSAHSLTSIRDRLNEGSADTVSNRSVKQLIIEMYGDAVFFTYSSNKRKSQMVLATNSSPEALVESLRVSPVQQELKEYRFGLKTSFCESKISKSPWTHSRKTHHQDGQSFARTCSRVRQHSVKD